MKKIIAILVVFALVAGVAFADTQISGSVETRWTIVQGSTEDNAEDPSTEGSVHAATISMSGTNDEGTFGGTLQLTLEGAGDNVFEGAWADRAFVWWQPIPQFRMTIGMDGDGIFGTTNLIRWGHHKMPRNVNVEDWDQQNFLLGHYDALAAWFTIKPIEELAINLVVGLGDRDGESDGAILWEDLLQERIMAQVAYSLEGVGTFYVTYKQRYVYGTGWPGGGWPFDATERIGFTFHSNSLVDGLAFEVGGNYAFDQQDGEDIDGPIRLGLGAHYDAGDWGVKFRAVMRPDTPSGLGDWFMLRADIMPFYNFDFGTLFCNIRIQTNETDDIGWHVNPYFRLPVPGDFRVGFMLEDHNGDGDMTWAIPLSFLFSF